MKRASSPTDEQAFQGNFVEEKEKRFLSPRQLAARWDCSPTTAQRIVKNAGIASISKTVSPQVREEAMRKPPGQFFIKSPHNGRDETVL
jgi:hypothetical protein